MSECDLQEVFQLVLTGSSFVDGVTKWLIGGGRFRLKSEEARAAHSMMEPRQDHYRDGHITAKVVGQD